MSCAMLLCLRSGRSGFEDAELLHSVAEGIAADVQEFSCLCLISVRHLEGLPDEGFLHFLQRNPSGGIRIPSIAFPCFEA